MSEDASIDGLVGALDIWEKWRRIEGGAGFLFSCFTSLRSMDVEVRYG